MFILHKALPPHTNKLTKIRQWPASSVRWELFVFFVLIKGSWIKRLSRWAFWGPNPGQRESSSSEDSTMPFTVCHKKQQWTDLISTYLTALISIILYSLFWGGLITNVQAQVKYCIHHASITCLQGNIISLWMPFKINLTRHRYYINSSLYTFPLYYLKSITNVVFVICN